MRFFKGIVVDNKRFRAFDINIFGLKEGAHNFVFEVTDGFFESFEESIVEKGRGNVGVLLQKTATMLQVEIKLDLQVELICDLSLEPLMMPIKKKSNLTIKFGEENEELSEDVIVIKRDTASINMASIIFELTSLEIPMKKVHPDYASDNRPELVYTSLDAETESTDENEDIDPRWAALKNLKN